MNDATPLHFDPIPFEDNLREIQEIRSCVADMTFAWANVENAMVQFFSQIAYKGNLPLASAIYFTPAGIEIRIKLVDSAFEAYAKFSGVRDHVLPHWETLINRLGHLRRTRNKVAHGQISTIAVGGKNHIRLTSPIFDLRQAMAQFMVHPNGAPGFKINGLTSNDIRVSINAVNDVIRKIDFFRGLVPLINEGKLPPLLEKLAELKAQDRSTPAQQDNQNPQEPSPQPPSSQK